jgi:hypothetical protein
MGTDNWVFDDAKLISSHIPRLRDVMENESPLIVEHRFYRAARAPSRQIFDEWDAFEAYLATQVAAGDAIYVWRFEDCCTDAKLLLSAKSPDGAGKVPVGGSY